MWDPGSRLSQRHGVALCATRVDAEDLPGDVGAPAPAGTAEGATRPLEEVEREHILGAVARAGGNHTRAAADLRIDLATLKRKLKAYGVASGAPGAATELGVTVRREATTARRRGR